jgi:hypothetical protein
LWQPRNQAIEVMISIVYFSMGLIMLLNAKRPESSKLFIDFVILANLLHAVAMMFFLQNEYQLVLDVVSIGLMGIIPLFIYPWGLKSFLVPNSE